MPLTPWREIVTPHPDIATGRYHQAEFAADLGEVIAGKADAEYQDPIEFFARTYLTEGMQRLLATAVKQSNRQRRGTDRSTENRIWRWKNA